MSEETTVSFSSKNVRLSVIRLLTLVHDSFHSYNHCRLHDERVCQRTLVMGSTASLPLRKQLILLAGSDT